MFFGEGFHKMLEVFLKVMDKVHIKEIAFSVLVVCGIILFAPDTFMEILGLFLWRNKYRSMVGLIFLFCLTCCIIWFFIYLSKELSQGNWRLKKITRKYLKSLISTEEKNFLIQNYYNSETKEFANMARVDITSGNVVSLTAAHIIYTGTRMGHGPESWSYNLQPSVRLYLNKAIRKKKIVVDIDGYKWNL